MRERKLIDPRLEGKVAVITGANHGIGAATAAALAAQGCRVFVAYCLPKDDSATAGDTTVGGPARYRAMQSQSGEPVARGIRERGGAAAAGEFDLQDAANVDRVLDTCESELGPADILINNHTHCVEETFDPAAAGDGMALISGPEIDRHMTINARGTALMMAEYLRRHIARGADWGRIINMTTTLQHARNVSYAASKGAIVSYTLSAASEMGRYGITVNVVGPGPTQTGYITPELETQLAADTPLGRVGRPDDVADTIVFLASEQARWLTGQIIYAGGGFEMHP
jgi:3-oxoacyl-[acyl-carrier protein] reductase